MTSAAALRALDFRIQQDRQQRKRSQDLAERAYLRRLTWTERELGLYQQRIAGIERRAEHRGRAPRPLLGRILGIEVLDGTRP